MKNRDDNQASLILSDDALDIVDRVGRIYGSKSLPLHELQTCWRPPSPPKRPWPDKRFWKALNEAEVSGAIRRRRGMCGDVLELVTKNG